jgi:hypothetical protein
MGMANFGLNLQDLGTDQDKNFPFMNIGQNGNDNKRYFRIVHSIDMKKKLETMNLLKEKKTFSLMDNLMSMMMMIK